MAKSEKYKLKDPETTFYDPETKLKVTRGSVVEIDAGKKKGKLTLAAINAGGLIEVKSESKAAAAEKESKSESKGAAEKEGKGK